MCILTMEVVDSDNVASYMCGQLEVLGLDDPSMHI